jgi:hypothetical protein
MDEFGSVWFHGDVAASLLRLGTAGDFVTVLRFGGHLWTVDGDGNVTYDGEPVSREQIKAARRSIPAVKRKK